MIKRLIQVSEKGHTAIGMWVEEWVIHVGLSVHEEVGGVRERVYSKSRRGYGF